MSTNKPSKLGKGLEALLPTNFATGSVINGRNEIASEVDIDLINAKNSQPRKKFDQEKIEQLSYSIKAHGVLQPIVLVKTHSGYEIVAGERRYRAAKLAGLKNIPAVVRTADSLQQLELALVENIQGEDLTPIEQALSIKRLKDEFSQDYASIAKRLGKAETTVINLTRLLNLPAPIQQSLEDGGISEGHARALLSVNGRPEVQSALYKNIVEAGWSVRQAEAFTRVHKASNSSPQVSRVMTSYTKWTKQLEGKLGRSVGIIRTAKGGKLTISFKTEEDLDELVKKLT